MLSILSKKVKFIRKSRFFILIARDAMHSDDVGMGTLFRGKHLECCGVAEHRDVIAHDVSK